MKFPLLVTYHAGAAVNVDAVLMLYYVEIEFASVVLQIELFLITPFLKKPRDKG